MGTLTNSAKLIDKIKNIKATGVDSSQPSNPTVGSMYYDQNDGVLKVYNGTEWEEVGGGGGGGGGFICKCTPGSRYACSTWPDGADFAIASSYDNTNSAYHTGLMVMFDKNELGRKAGHTCGNSGYFQAYNCGTYVCADACGGMSEIAFFGKAKGEGKAAFLDVLVVGGGGGSSCRLGGGGGGICSMTKMPIYTQGEIMVTVGSGGIANYCCCSGCNNKTMGGSSSFGSISVSGGNVLNGSLNIGKSGKPQSCNKGEDKSWRPTNACYTTYSYGGSAGNSDGQDGCIEYEDLGPANCTGGYNTYLLRTQGHGGDGFVSNITGENKTYGGGGGAGYQAQSWLWAGNIGVQTSATVLPSCGGGSGGNGYGLDRYELSIYGYNGCYTCRVPNCCYVVNDQGDHDPSPRYYGGGAGGGLKSSNIYPSSGQGSNGCQGIVIVRYPTDGSYGLTNDTLGGDITTKTIDGKERRIHTFTDTQNICCFYPVFK